MHWIMNAALPWFQATYQASLRFCPRALLSNAALQIASSKYKFKPLTLTHNLFDCSFDWHLNTTGLQASELGLCKSFYC